MNIFFIAFLIFIAETVLTVHETVMINLQTFNSENNSKYASNKPQTTIKFQGNRGVMEFHNPHRSLQVTG